MDQAFNQELVSATISVLPTARKKRKSQAKQKLIAAKTLVDKWIR